MTASRDARALARNRHFGLLEVVGRSYVGIYDSTHLLAPAGRFYVLRAGDRFDLAERQATRPGRRRPRIA